MRIYLDDVRTPGADWSDATVCRTGEEVIAVIEKAIDGKGPHITGISFDHDLGDGITGYDVARRIEAEAFHGTIPPIMEVNIHSANPVGAANIEAAMLSAHKYWQTREAP